MEVDVRTLDPLVAKEQRDAGEVDAALVELHGCAVAENVRRHILAHERRARERGGRDVFRDQPLNRIVTEPCPLLGGEDRLVRAATPLLEPDPESGDGWCREWSPTGLTTLPEDADVGAGAEMHVGNVGADEFGETEPGLESDEEQSVVAATVPGRPVR